MNKTDWTLEQLNNHLDLLYAKSHVGLIPSQTNLETREVTQQASALLKELREAQGVTDWLETLLSKPGGVGAILEDMGLPSEELVKTFGVDALRDFGVFAIHDRDTPIDTAFSRYYMIGEAKGRQTEKGQVGFYFDRSEGTIERGKAFAYGNCRLDAHNDSQCQFYGEAFGNLHDQSRARFTGHSKGVMEDRSEAMLTGQAKGFFRDVSMGVIAGNTEFLAEGSSNISLHTKFAFGVFTGFASLYYVDANIVGESVADKCLMATPMVRVGSSAYSGKILEKVDTSIQKDLDNYRDFLLGKRVERPFQIKLLSERLIEEKERRADRLRQFKL